MPADPSVRHAITPLLVTVKQVAELLGISVRQVYKLNASGRLPRPVKLGRSVRWNRDELKRWIYAGSPNRARWETIEKKRVK